MFTGIVSGTAEVLSIDEKDNFRTHVVKLPAQLLLGWKPVDRWHTTVVA
jgi:riboflavin synthase